MGISREEIGQIAKEAAEKQLEPACLTIATDIDSVIEDAIDPLHTAIYEYGVISSKAYERPERKSVQKASVLKSIETAQDAVQQSIIDTGYAKPEDIAHMTVRLGRIYQLVKEDKLYDAMEMVETLSDDMFHLMLRTVVACEFQVGKGANPGSEYITIVDPGNTTFKPGEVISKEAFDKENERVRKLGGKSATGKPSA